jgi:hypothetical protein
VVGEDVFFTHWLGGPNIEGPVAFLWKRTGPSVLEVKFLFAPPQSRVEA